jgi:hypothetical protein
MNCQLVAFAGAAGAFRKQYGHDSIADEIVKRMSAAGYDVRESDPFNDRPALTLPYREKSP